MMPREDQDIIARVRAKHARLQMQQVNTDSRIEKAAIQAKIDALMIEFREAQRVSLGQRPVS